MTALTPAASRLVRAGSPVTPVTAAGRSPPSPDVAAPRFVATGAALVVRNRLRPVRGPPRAEPRERSLRGERSASRGVCPSLRRVRRRRSALGRMAMMAGAVGDLVHRDAGGEGAGGQHRAQLGDQHARRPGTGAGHRVRSRTRGIGGPESQRPHQWVRERRGHRLAQRQPGAMDELANGALRQSHPRRHQRPWDSVHRGADQCIALTARQRAQPGQRGPGRRPSLHDLLQRLGAGLIGQRRLDRSVGAAGGVAHDRVQPASEVRHLRPAVQRGPGVQERLLHDVVGAFVGRQAPGVRQQLRLIALDDRLERRLIAGARQLDQSFVGRVVHAGPGQRTSHIHQDAVGGRSFPPWPAGR